MVFYILSCVLCMYLAAGSSEMIPREDTNFHPDRVPIGTYYVFRFRSWDLFRKKSLVDHLHVYVKSCVTLFNFKEALDCSCWIAKFYIFFACQKLLVFRLLIFHPHHQVAQCLALAPWEPAWDQRLISPQPFQIQATCKISVGSVKLWPDTKRTPFLEVALAVSIDRLMLSIKSSPGTASAVALMEHRKSKSVVPNKRWESQHYYYTF